MDHAVDATHRVPHRTVIANVSLDGRAGDILAGASRQDDRFMAAVEQRADNGASEIAGSACHQHLHLGAPDWGLSLGTAREVTKVANLKNGAPEKTKETEKKIINKFFFVFSVGSVPPFLKFRYLAPPPQFPFASPPD